MASPSGETRRGRPSLQQAHAVLGQNGLFDSAIVFWRGTSGHSYVHTIYSLTGCPDMQPASVMLVRHAGGGRRAVLHVMTVDHPYPSLNLAAIRQTGARLGANEVHVHFAGGSALARRTASIDLKTRYSAGHVLGK